MFYDCSLLGHNFHIWEICFLVLLVLAVIFLFVMVTKGNVPVQGVGILSALTAVLGFILLWNYFRVKSLANTAIMLRRVRAQGERNLLKQRALNKASQEINDELSHENGKLKTCVHGIFQQTGLLGSSVEELDILETKLYGLLNSHRELMAQERVFNDKALEFLKQQEENRLDLARREIRRKLRDRFEDITGGALRRNWIDVKTELGYLLKTLNEHNITYRDDFDKNNDGRLTLLELMEAMDTVLNEHFTSVQSALEQKTQLLRQSGLTEEKLRDAATQLVDWKPNTGRRIDSTGGGGGSTQGMSRVGSTMTRMESSRVGDSKMSRQVSRAQ